MGLSTVVVVVNVVINILIVELAYDFVGKVEERGFKVLSRIWPKYSYHSPSLWPIYGLRVIEPWG